jgi:hypothetical protein
MRALPTKRGASKRSTLKGRFGNFSAGAEADFIVVDPQLPAEITSYSHSLAMLATTHFPMQKRLKITPSKSSDENAPVMLDSCACARRNSSANKSSD